MIRCAISTSNPSTFKTTVRLFNNVSVISLASSTDVGLITHTSIPARFCCFLDGRIGVPFAERQIVAFIPDALYYEWQFPIAYLEIVPSYPKFAEKLGHRDILGSMMNLGVDRSKLGDIVICEDKYFLICEESMAPYFMENLDKIRHTVVKLSPVSADALEQQQKFEERDGIITSNRLDSMIACVYKFSRSQALEFFKAEKVFVNGKCVQNPSYRCKEADIISVRGYGRFVFEREMGETNKGRMKVRYKLYG